VLKETYGVIVYQEQVMQIAQILAGYSLGEADLLRRAMGKKKKEEMDLQKIRFVSGAKDKGVSRSSPARSSNWWTSSPATVSTSRTPPPTPSSRYQTAWLKANTPVEFFAASMSLDMSNTDKLAVFHQDAKPVRASRCVRRTSTPRARTSRSRTARCCTLWAPSATSASRR
jgi:DNA polymerase-3 subunit alpha